MPRAGRWSLLVLLLQAALAAGAASEALQSAPVELVLEPLPPVPPQHYQYLAYDPSGMAVHATDGLGSWQRWIAATGWLAEQVTTDAPGGPLTAAGPGYAVARSAAGVGLWQTGQWPPRRLSLADYHAPGGEAPQAVTYSRAVDWVVGAVGASVYTWRPGEPAAFGELRGHEPRRDEPAREAITAVAVDSAGRGVAAADAGGMIWFWKSFDARATGYAVHRGEITTLAFAGSKLLVSASTDGSLQVSDPARKLLVWSHRPSDDGRRYDPNSLLVSADGTLIAIQAGDTTVLHEVATGRLVRELAAPAPAVSYALALSGDGHRLAYGCGEALWVWEPFSGSLVRGAGGSARERLESIELSPDGRYLMAGAGAKLYCWDLLGQRTVPSSVEPEPESLCLFQRNELVAQMLPHGGIFGGGKWLSARAARPFFETGSTRFRVSLGDRRLQFDAASPGPAREAVETSGPSLPELDRETLDEIETAIARSRPADLREPSRPRVRPFALGPDGRTLACFSWQSGAKEFRPDPKRPVPMEAWARDQIVLYDLERRETRGVLDLPCPPAGQAIFSPDGQLYAAQTYEGGVVVCEVATAKPRWSAEPGFAPVLQGGISTHLAFTPDSAHLVARRGSRIMVVDSSSGRVTWNWEAPLAAAKDGRPVSYHPISTVTLGQSADRVAVRAADDLIAVHRLADGAPIASFTLPSHIAAATFSPDRRWLALLRYDGRVAFLPVDGPAPAEPPWPNGRVISFLDTAANLQDACGLAWSPDGDWLVAVALGQLVVWDARQRRPVRKVVDGIMVPIDPAPEPDGGLARRLDGGQVTVTERAGGQVVARWQPHAGAVRQAVLAAGGQRLATLSEEGEIALWSLPRPVKSAPSRICRLWHFTDPAASVWVTDNEWCDGPLGIERLVCWRLGAQTVPFGQFEPSRRRPDKVTEALTGQPVAAEGEPPGLRFLKPASGTETNGRQIVVELAVSGPRWVTRVDLSVNGLPAQSLGTANGVAKAVVPLPAGETEARLRAVAVNDRGQVSAPAQVTVFASGYQARLGALRVLSIGLNRYRSPGIPPLSYSVADATAMAEGLAAQGKDKPYPEVERTLLCDAQANLANVAVALQALKAHARANDTVVIFLAGHGISKEGEFYFGTYDLDLERLETTALNWRDFARALRDIGTFRVLVLADTCHAGGIVGSSGEQAHVLRRVSDDTGRLVFSASRENEPSFGFAELGHGAFTQAILEALRGPGDANRDGAVSYGELTRYVSPRVAQLTEGRQHPELPLVDPDLPLDDTFAWTTTP